MKPTKEITIQSSHLSLTVSTYGATIMSLIIRDKDNNPTNVVVGLNSTEDYKSENYQKSALYLGASIGRFAGRISKGYVKIDSNYYTLNHLEGVHLHGGTEGFDKKDWKIEHINHGQEPSIKLSYLSPHLEEGYPANLKIFVTFSILNHSSLNIEYTATADQATIVNVTNHTYYNLNGHGSVLDHSLQINSDAYLEVDKSQIPTGNILPIQDSSLDYRTIKTLSTCNFDGLDDTFILNEQKLKVVLKSERTGILMKVYSNQPAMVVYTPKEFPNLPFKNKVEYSKFPGICFETQKHPDAPHHTHFSSVILRPKQIYSNKSIFMFSNF